ncbi:AGE family epimerase/isomerase [Georgenia subflava]|uniref:N-acylglucosamine 2-epimerase n=1 Tax=Georgenia subflava TaxID=1622177 RepID=A0A6N7EHV2_9MICO|nr:AGE family epimerase/isomerase [Georgenia subflava]MPV36693.1 N-acylglucosamine 2-epimerase [Georgenia subflava]
MSSAKALGAEKEPSQAGYASTDQVRRERLQAYESHLFQDVLPWWLNNAVDRKHGGVFTFWNTDGTRLYSTTKYSWSLGRWIWALVACADLAEARGAVGIFPPQLRALAETTGEFLWSHGMLGGGRVANFLTREGIPTAGFTGEQIYASVFADLFAALGFAALGREGATAERNVWGARADDLLASASERIARGQAPTAPYPVPPGYAAFAPHMILVNAATEVHRATGSERSKRVLSQSCKAVIAHFVNGADICELVDPNSGENESLYARHRNPGHALEVLWFLRDAADTVPEVEEAMEQHLGRPLNDWLVDAALLALERGWDREYGGILRFVDVDGGPPSGNYQASEYWEMIGRTWDYKLWWPHNEALYTLLLLHDRTGDPRIWDWFVKADQYTFNLFPAGAGKEWKQIFDRRGGQLDTDAGSALPVKDPFHLIRCLSLLGSLPHS